MDVDGGDAPFYNDNDIIPDVPPRSPSVQAEEVEDEERVWMRFIQTYPGQVAQSLGQARTLFDSIRAEQEAQGLDPWAPFADEEEWGLVKWLIVRVGQTTIEEFMKLPITSHLKMSFTSKYLLMKAINKLPHRTKWQLKRIQVKGNSEQAECEDLELWLRNPVDCIHELMANPEFDGKVSYSPERVFVDVEGTTRQYDKMWTGEWWWETQGRLPEGAVIAPIILTSDKTSLSQFQGDQEVWPVYLTLGNISKDVRRQPLKHAAVLIAYLPMTKLECFSQEMRSLERYRLFHYCMSLVLEPLISAGNDGIEVTCPDRKVWRMHPIVAAYVEDFPEQCLVACCMENRCPKCTVGHNEQSTLESLRLHQDGEMNNGQFEGELRLQAIYSPFWATLPHNDIFTCITPNILHQLHKGVFKDHLEELDARLRHFKKGISKWKQWTGADYRELQRVFLGVIAVRGYQTHMDMTLSHMHNDIFLKLGVREHFNIPKFHLMLHYVDAIRLFGSADGSNTELPERLHIDFAKRAYRASNRCDYIIQMTTWLRRQESIAIQEAYL
ncbi:hypothetical protein EDD22DRAFT_982766 [Suillus occidentalis]|nr:hypothetical protein EDD22DRAFT_982766 [Suillus occidentalis]